jgi:predicted DNA-binding ribbon-helix-helix protein
MSKKEETQTRRGVVKTLTFNPALWEAVEKVAEKRRTMPLRLIYSILEEKIAEYEKELGI